MVTSELAAACRPQQVGLGFYLSPRDDTHGTGVGGNAGSPARQAAYNEICRRQLAEIGNMVET